MTPWTVFLAEFASCAAFVAALAAYLYASHRLIERREQMGLRRW